MIAMVTTKRRGTATQLPGPPHFCKCFGCCCAHLMQRLRALQPNVYICVGTSHDMFFLPYVAFPASYFLVPFSSTSFPPLHLPSSFHHQPQDKHREIHSWDGGQGFDLSAYIQGSQVQWRGIEVLQVQHATV